MRIAMIGQRGVPASVGGVERHVEEVGARLAAAGHEVIVYCRDNYVTSGIEEHRGMRLAHLPAPRSKHLEAVTHSAASTRRALATRPDVVHFHALGPGLFSPVARYASQARVVQTIHGLDDERAKWGGLAQRVLRTARWLSERTPDAVITVSRALAELYREVARPAVVYLPNGVEPPVSEVGDEKLVTDLGLTPGRYALFVGRLVPEKAPDLLLDAYRQVPGGDHRLAIVGGSSYTDGFVGELEATAARDPRVRMLGWMYGPRLTALYRHAAAFVLPSHLEGLPLTLLEAAAAGAPVVASAIPPHVEVVGSSRDGAWLFPPGDRAALTARLREALLRPGPHGSGLRESVLAQYRWDETARRTEELYRRLLDGEPVHDLDAAVTPYEPARTATSSERLLRLDRVAGGNERDIDWDTVIDVSDGQRSSRRGASASGGQTRASRRDAASS